MGKYRESLERIAYNFGIDCLEDTLRKKNENDNLTHDMNVIYELVDKQDKYRWRSQDEIPTQKTNAWSSVDVIIQTSENLDGFRPNNIILGWYDYINKCWCHENMGFDDEFIDVKAWRYVEQFEEQDEDF